MKCFSSVLIVAAMISTQAPAFAAPRSGSTDCLSLGKSVAQEIARTSRDPSERLLAYFSPKYNQLKTQVIVDADCVPGNTFGCQGTQYIFKILAANASSCTLDDGVSAN